MCPLNIKFDFLAKFAPAGDAQSRLEFPKICRPARPALFWPAFAVLASLLLLYHEKEGQNEAPRDQKDTLLSPGLSYLRMESVSIPYKGKRIHLYTTDTVRKIYRDYLAKLKEDPGMRFADFILKENRLDALPLEENATDFFSNRLLKKHEVHIKNQSLYRDGNFLPEGNYIFILNQKKKLLAATKRPKGPNGRTQHSSLSLGKPVLAAGNFSISSGSQILTLETHSGHYKPPPQNLDRLIEWLKDRGLKFSVISDSTSYEEKPSGIRTVKLQIEAVSAN